MKSCCSSFVIGSEGLHITNVGSWTSDGCGRIIAREMPRLLDSEMSTFTGDCPTISSGHEAAVFRADKPRKGDQKERWRVGKEQQQRNIRPTFPLSTNFSSAHHTHTASSRSLTPLYLLDRSTSHNFTTRAPFPPSLTVSVLPLRSPNSQTSPTWYV